MMGDLLTGEAPACEDRVGACLAGAGQRRPGGGTWSRVRRPLVDCTWDAAMQLGLATTLAAHTLAWPVPGLLLQPSASPQAGRPHPPPPHSALPCPAELGDFEAAGRMYDACIQAIQGEAPPQSLSTTWDV